MLITTSLSGGIIPACAGSTITVNVGVSRHRDHPRMCGEHSLVSAVNVLTVGSSPHVRGAHLFYHLLVAVRGIIPACAGSTDLLTGLMC